MNDYSKYKAKKTFYNGTEFKSKLEAKVAKRFDELGIYWEYERYCYMGDEYAGGQYTPDFYLPRLDCFVEVAGVWDERHCQNFKHMFNSFSKGAYSEPETFNPYHFGIVGIDNQGNVVNPLDDHCCWGLAQCKECKEYRFIDINGSYDCPYCHAYDGDAYLIFSENIFSDVFLIPIKREDDEVCLSFGRYLTEVEHVENLVLNDYKQIIWDRSPYDYTAMYTRYGIKFEKWVKEQREIITKGRMDKAIKAITDAGHKVVNSNFQQGQINASNINNKKFTFYVNTGTIARSNGKFEGLQDLLKLLNGDYSLTVGNVA